MGLSDYVARQSLGIGYLFDGHQNPSQMKNPSRYRLLVQARHPMMQLQALSPPSVLSFPSIDEGLIPVSACAATLTKQFSLFSCPFSLPVTLSVKRVRHTRRGHASIRCPQSVVKIWVS
jgi:hypothetical protein